MIPGAHASSKVELVAVASRDQPRADEYAKTWEIERAYGSYDALLADPEIEAVYISLPNPDMQPRLAGAKEVLLFGELAPDMAKLKELKQRDPDDFELAALDALSQGEDYFVRQKNREIRMVGSLRAVGQCASCHDVERGTLLGAFSYRLVKR